MGNMNIKQLEKEIESLGIDPENINIGVRGRYDGCFNLLQRKNGKWEIFYGEQGKKKDAQTFNSQKEACDAFALLLRIYLNRKGLEDKPAYWKGYRRNATPFARNFLTGLFIFGVLIGVAGAGYQIYIGEINFMFWIYIGWIIVFALIAYFTRDDRRNEMFEHYSMILVMLFNILMPLAIMIALPVSYIPKIISGEEGWFAVFILILVEGLSAFWIYGICLATKEDYGDEFREFIEDKKAKAKERREAKAAKRSEDNP